MYSFMLEALIPRLKSWAFCLFDRKRHSSVYDAAGIISAAEAEVAVSAAEALVQKIAMLPG